MTRTDEHDVIDDMLAGVAGFLGVRYERGSPRSGGLRALVESTILELAEGAATATKAEAGLAPAVVAELLYTYADIWATDVAALIRGVSALSEEADGQLQAWLDQKRAEERTR